jgi:tetratricopeptide (TPR) repeat protein
MINNPVKKHIYGLLACSLAGLLVACGTSKNTKASRFYHAVTSHYNIYYNGKTSFDEALASLQNGYKESYTDRILMYPISAQPKEKATTGGAFDRAIEKGNKAVKMHSIQAKPPKKPGWRNKPKQLALQQQEEYNPFLKKCWMLMGQGQFYNADFLQASATFSYIARHYAQDEEMVAEARLWQARCYSELGWFYEAENILGKLNTNGIPEACLDRYAAVYADYLLKNKRDEEAVPYLNTAIGAEKNRRQRTRMKYLLGQLYADLQLDGPAYKTFGEVARSNPPYELEFAARIRQTEVFPESRHRQVIKMLEGMARSDKNKDYLDQVYYALGNVYMAKRDTAEALAHYEQGIEKSTQNGMDKAILWIRMGDVYFRQRDYIRAQPCFSGAAGIIAKEYREYERISKLSAVLDELVVHAEAIHLQDSLQTLARMPEEERLAVIDGIIERVIEEEKEAKALAEKESYLAEQESMGGGVERPGTGINVPTLPTAPGESTFYFYNSQMVAQGKTQFQRKWGRRTLEDDWRRRNRQMSTFEENAGEDTVAEQPAMPGDSASPAADSLSAELPEEVSDDPKTREYYLQQIPSAEEEMEASNLIIIDGLYQMAMIYKDRLEDFPLAVEGFEELERRFPENEHLQECYYQIYLLALRTKDSALADRYRAKMAASFPESDYTLVVTDPDYEHTVRSMDSVQSAIYEATYHSYLAEDTAAVRLGYEQIASQYPLASLLPKFMFLHALTYVQKGEAEGFKEALKQLVEKYPKADVSELAGEMLKGVLRGREPVQGGVKGMIWNLRFGLDDGGVLSAADSARSFTAEKNLPCRVVLMYPAGRIDRNRLLFAVAAYNFTHFMVKDFDLTQDETGALGTLTVGGFIHFDEVMQYYTQIYGTDGYAATLSPEIAVLPISDANYETLMRGKTLDEYILFLEENFSEEAPALIARLRARLDAALMEEEAPDEEELPTAEEAPAETEAPSEEAVPPVPEEDPQPEVRQDEVAVAETDTIAPIPSDTVAAPEILSAEPSPATELQKTPAQLRKEKERAYKERQKQKARERKEKERAYKQKLKEREKARRQAQKEKKTGK